LPRDLYGDGDVYCLSDRAIINHLPDLMASHRHLVSVLLIENPLLVDDLLNDLLTRG
jgi:hypothetical protein